QRAGSGACDGGRQGRGGRRRTTAPATGTGRAGTPRRGGGGGRGAVEGIGSAPGPARIPDRAGRIEGPGRRRRPFATGRSRRHGRTATRRVRAGIDASEVGAGVCERDRAGSDPPRHARDGAHRQPTRPAAPRSRGLHFLGGRIHAHVGPDRGTAHQPRLRGARGGRGRRRPASPGPAGDGRAGDGPTPVNATGDIVVARDLRKTFSTGGGGKVAALEAISLSIPPGQLTAMVGPDGAGKTTFLRMLAG